MRYLKIGVVVVLLALGGCAGGSSVAGPSPVLDCSVPSGAPSCITTTRNFGPSQMVRLMMDDNTSVASPVTVQLVLLRVVDTTAGRRFTYSIRLVMDQENTPGAVVRFYMSNDGESIIGDAFGSGNVSPGTETLVNMVDAGMTLPYQPFSNLVLKSKWGITGVGYLTATGSVPVN